jgi:hypothetical protein
VSYLNSPRKGCPRGITMKKRPTKIKKRKTTSNKKWKTTSKKRGGKATSKIMENNLNFVF